jgi:hypothetical protein
MKDLVELIIRELVAFLPLLIGIIRAPSRTILSLMEDSSSRLSKALSFCGITLAIGVALQAPLLQKGQDFVSVAGSLMVLRFVAVLTFAGVIQAVFKLLGGKGDYEVTLCACLYIVSPVYLFLVFSHLLGLGILTTHAPQLAAEWRFGRDITSGELDLLVKSSPVMATGFLAVMISRFVISVLWMFACWKTYRIIHAVTKAKSAVAYCVSTGLWYIYWILTGLIMRGLYGGSLSPIG